MLLGKVLSETALSQGKFVTYLPSYGAEVRGGTANCMVVISDSEIGSPRFETADTLIIMNNPSLDKFYKCIKRNGLLIVNSSLASEKGIKHSNTCAFAFTDIAVKLGNIKIANMVAAGLYAAKKKIVSIESINNVIKELAPKGRDDLVQINKKAVFAGASLIK